MTGQQLSRHRIRRRDRRLLPRCQRKHSAQARLGGIPCTNVLFSIVKEIGAGLLLVARDRFVSTGSAVVAGT
jgi:hypothetical protein